MRGKPAKKSGKGAKQRKSDKFRMDVGTKQLQERRTATEKRLGLFDDAGAELVRSLLQLSITNFLPVAVPLTAASRGIGFSSVVEYSRMCTTWNFDAIVEICTIYQYYRVALHLFYYKLYLARYEQSETPSFDVVAPFVFNDEIRQILGLITQVPISTYNILSSIGKIDSSVVWHSVPFQGQFQDGEQAALYLYPDNIRGALMVLSDIETDRAHRDRFHELNPLPGAFWVEDPDEGWFLNNADDIWPEEYTPAMLMEDVHCYQNLLTRVAGRLPKSFICNFKWTGMASKSGTVSFDPLPLRLHSSFEDLPAVRRAPRRDACGRMITQAAAAKRVRTYHGDNLQGTTFDALVWSPDSDTTPIEMISGSASFVGEHSMQATRLQINGRKQAHIAPGTMLYKLVDAPCPATT